MAPKDERGAGQSVRKVPDADRAILAGGGEPLAVGTPGDAEDSAAFAGDDQRWHRARLRQASVRSEIPDSHLVILSGRREPTAVGAEGDVGRPAFVGPKRMIKPTQHDVPDLDLAVRAGGGQASAAAIDRRRRRTCHRGRGCGEIARPSAVSQIESSGRSDCTAKVRCTRSKIDAAEEGRMARDREDVAAEPLLQVSPLPASKSGGHSSSSAAMRAGSSRVGLVFARSRSIVRDAAGVALFLHAPLAASLERSCRACLALGHDSAAELGRC